MPKAGDIDPRRILDKLAGKSYTVRQLQVAFRSLRDDEKDQQVRLLVGDATDASRSRMLTAMLTDFFDGSNRRAIEFERAFSGAILVMPDSAFVERMAVESRVSSSLSHDPSPANRLLTASRLGLDVKEVSAIARDAKK